MNLDSPHLEIHKAATVVDLHVDTLLDLAAGKRDLDGASSGGHVDLPRLRQGGVDVQVFAAFIHPQEADRGFSRAHELISAFDQALARYPEQIARTRTVAEIDAAVQAGNVAAVLAIENGGDAIEGIPERVDTLHARGVRMMGLTWNNANAVGDGVMESRHGGITPAGRQMLARMEDLRIVIDVSHLSEPTFWDVLDATRAPLVASHSDASAVCDHRRNLTDAQLRALARRGGVVGINFYPTFLGEATLDRVVAHIEHMVDVTGPDHIALGSDFDGISQVPAGLEDVSRMPNVTEALLARGYQVTDVSKILGANALRVFRQVWGG